MKSLKKFLYFAYGTNVNKKFFLKKFKNAKYLKKYYLNNFEVVFRSKYGVPDIQRKKGCKVNGIIYQIDNLIEKKLDIYEDFPRLYIKKYFYHKGVKIMYYYMKIKSPIRKPSQYYLNIMKSGYRQCGFRDLLKM